MFGLKSSEIEIIKKELSKIGIKKSIVFGSRAIGREKRGSDVDIAIVGDELKANYILNEETNLPYYFDVINLEKITNKELLEHIKRVGKTL